MTGTKKNPSLSNGETGGRLNSGNFKPTPMIPRAPVKSTSKFRKENVSAFKVIQQQVIFTLLAVTALDCKRKLCCQCESHFPNLATVCVYKWT